MESAAERCERRSWKGDYIEDVTGICGVANEQMEIGYEKVMQIGARTIE
jgi:hypothetical protein